MSYLKRILIGCVAAVVLVFSTAGCTPWEQEVFFVRLGDPVAQTQTLEEARAAWTPEAATESQLLVIAHLKEQQRLYFEGIVAAQNAVSPDCFTAIDKHFSGPKEWFKGIVWRESRNIPSAANPSSTARGCAQLLMSLHSHRYYAVGCTPNDWANPDCNIKAADHLYRQAGTSPWSL